MSSKSKVHFWKTRNVLKSHHQLHLIGIDSAMAMDSGVKDVDFFEANWNNNDLDNPTLSQICEIWSHENLAFKGELSLNYNEDGYGDFGVGMDTGQTRNATWRRIYAFDDTGNRKPETSCVLSGEFKHKKHHEMGRYVFKISRENRAKHIPALHVMNSQTMAYWLDRILFEMRRMIGQYRHENRYILFYVAFTRVC